MAGPGRRGLSRRTLLRGCTAGLAAAVALPTLEAMLNTNGTALADGRALPCRFGVWFWGNGVRLDQWVPSDLGPGYAPSPSLQPLADAGVLPQVSVISGLTVPHGQEVVHDVGRAVMLSGSYSVDEPTVGLGGNAIIRSIDQIAADTLSEGARFRSLEVGVSKVGFGGQPDTASVSWEEPVSPLPAEFSPHALYQRLFGDVLADASFLEARRSVLDVVREDTLDLRAKLGAPDRIRLDAHLDGLRAIEQQLVAIAPSCALPDSPHVLPDQPLANEPLVERATALSDLLVVALSCDLTRVFNFRYSPSAADTYFHPVGAAEAHHVMSHDGGQLEGLQQIVEFIMGQLGYFLQRLSETDDGDGSLLDHTVVYGVSDLAEGLTHITADMPILLAGGARGALVAGTHERLADGESTSRAGLTALRAAGVSVNEFGEGIGKSTQVIDALFA